MKNFDELLNQMQYKHTGGKAFDIEEHTQMQCKWSNDVEGFLNKTDGYNCELCKNKGYIYKVKDGNMIVQADCRCRKIRAVLKRARASGLGNVLQDNTFDKFEAVEEWQKNMKRAAEEFCKDENARFIYYGGQPGSGKSHLCTAISGYYIKHGCDVAYMMWKDDAQRIKAVANDFQLYQEQIAPFKKAEVLYIDDFWKVKGGTEPTAADVNLAFEIINYRIIENMTTIISSEYTIAQALEIDEATVSRIFKAAGRYRITIPKDISKNYRLKEC